MFLQVTVVTLSFSKVQDSCQMKSPLFMLSQCGNWLFKFPTYMAYVFCSLVLSLKTIIFKWSFCQWPTWEQAKLPLSRDNFCISQFMKYTELQKSDMGAQLSPILEVKISSMATLKTYPGTCWGYLYLLWVKMNVIHAGPQSEIAVPLRGSFQMSDRHWRSLFCEGYFCLNEIFVDVLI